MKGTSCDEKTIERPIIKSFSSAKKIFITQHGENIKEVVGVVLV
jgi:hypothetical protein